MTVGKKISGGFCIILLLTLVLGYLAISAMQDGVKTSENISKDRVPRFTVASSLESDILEYARLYFMFETYKSDEYIEKLERQNEIIKDDIIRLQELQNKHPYPDTGVFLDKFPKDLEAYLEVMRSCIVLIQSIQENNVAGLRAGKASEVSLEKLIAALGRDSRFLMEAGQGSQAAILTQYMSTVSADLTDVGNLIKDALVAQTMNDEALFSKLGEKSAVVIKHLEELRGKFDRREYSDLLEQSIAASQGMGKQIEQLQAIHKQLREHSKNRLELYNSLKQQTLSLSTAVADNTQNEVNRAAETLSASTTQTIIILIGVLVLGIGASLFITRMIVKPLVVTQAFAKAVADGDLEKKLDIHGTDEIGMLADDLRQMVTSLKENINEAQRKSREAQTAMEEAREAMGRAEEAARRAENAKREGMLGAAGQLEGMVDIISSASTELSSQIEQSNRTAAESARHLSEAATAMNEMNSTVQDVAKNASNASGASSDTKQRAEAGAQVVHEVVRSIGEVQNVSIHLKEEMEQLNAHAQAITQIMSVISDIADQTNLLALNAAIEAARAGDAGRGFAVVADEVRKLAEKTMSSTQDVGNAISVIQESTAKSMEAMDNAVSRISDATELANQSGAALREIVSTADDTFDRIQAIATASEEQSAASEEINRSIITVNDMSRQTASSMTEAAKAVADLAAQAQSLTGLIQEMKKA